jgi:ATP-dependent DNA helicase RecG
MQPSSIDDKRLQMILDAEEGHFLDHKAKEVSLKKISKSIAAFANADGGEVFLGIREIDKAKKIRKWDGFDRIEDANGQLQELNKSFPLGAGFSYDFLSHPKEHGFVLRVEVEKSPRVVKTPDGEVYIRLGAASIPQTSPDELKRLEYNKGLISYEDERIRLEPQEIENSLVMIKFALRIVPEAEPSVWLRKQRMIVGDLPTVCGLMLFSDEPQIALPKSAIKIYRYKGSENEGRRENLTFDPMSIEGCAYDTIYGAVDKVRMIIEDINVVTESGLKKVAYPPVALHEIITNAVLHRDYSVADDVHIRIFDDRVEIESPGKLPAHITEKNILQERFLRNGKLVRLINKFPNPPNKDVGEGLNTSFQAMRDLKLKDPIIKQKENSVLVTLKHEKLGSAEEVISKYLEDHDEINNAKARELCFIGDANKMAGIFKKMSRAGIIETIPGRAQVKTGYRRGPNFK